MYGPCVSGNVRVSCIRFLFGSYCREGEGTMPLTKRQKEILDYIHGFIDEHGYAPSFEEIAHCFRVLLPRHRA